jgi:hypothetical protein
MNIFSKYPGDKKEYYSSKEEIELNNNCLVELIESAEEVVNKKNKEKKLQKFLRMMYVFKCINCNDFYFVVKYHKYEKSDDGIKK